MQFFITCGNEEIKIRFEPTETAINYLIEGGFLSEEYNADDFKYHNEFDSILSDGVCDWIYETANNQNLISRITGNDEELEGIDIFTTIIDMNLFLSQYLVWEWC